MTVVVNGDKRQIEDRCNVANLVLALGLKPDRLAVEVNSKIIRKADWSSTALADGDKVEVVHFVGGG